MKRDIKRLIILSVFLIIFSSIILILFGKTYIKKYYIKNLEDYEIFVENDAGEIEIIDEKRIDDELILKVKSVKPGKVYLYLKHNEFSDSTTLYIHKNMLITDNNYFGKSRGSEVIPISLLIVLLYVLVVLIKRYNYHVKENLYQYRNIAYLGIIIFVSFLTLSNIISIFNYQGLFTTINNIVGSASFISFFIFPIALITFILVTISNIRLIQKEGKSFQNLLGLFFGILICLSTLLPDFIYRILMKAQIVDIYNLNSIGPYLYDFMETLLYLTISYLECVLLGTIIIGIKSVRKRVDYDKDYMIILGCQIAKDGSLFPLLKGRVDNAIKFRNKQLEVTNKDLIFIPSGGKGENEVMSEGEAIKNYLLEQGINEKNIIVENKSKNTYENIKFSNKLINNKNAKVAFSTTNYHVLRAGLIATEQGLKYEGIGSKTKAYFWINAFIREFIGTLYSEKKKHIITFILITIIITIMIIIIYFANNIN